MTSQSIKTTKTESKTPRNRSHQNQNLRTTQYPSFKEPNIPGNSNNQHLRRSKKTKNRNWIRSIKLPVVAVSEWLRSESRIMGNITEENDEDVASISKHVAYLHCWQWDWVKTSKKKKNRRSGSVVVDLPATLSRCYEIQRNFWIIMVSTAEKESNWFAVDSFGRMITVMWSYYYHSSLWVKMEYKEKDAYRFGQISLLIW